jgi:DNA-binding response OmpR family regulator
MTDRHLALLFEDDPAIRDLVTDVLHDAGFEVHAYRSAKDVDPTTLDLSSALVILDGWGSVVGDITVEERDGLRAFGALVPTILMTARHWATGMLPADLGIARILPKPVDLDDFDRAVQELVSRAN